MKFAILPTMGKGSWAGPIAAGIVAGATFLVLLFLKTGTGSDAILAFAAFSVFSLVAAIVGFVFAAILRSKIAVPGALAVGLLSGILSIAVLFIGMQALSDNQRNAAKMARIERDQGTLDDMLANGFPELSGLEISEHNYQLDAGPSVVMFGPGNAADTCQKLRASLQAWTEASFDGGCWFGRTTVNGSDQVRVSPSKKGVSVKLITRGAQQKLRYESAEAFCKMLREQKYKDAEALLEPRYRDLLKAKGGLEKWVERNDIELGGINLYPNMERFAQPIERGGYLVLIVRGGLPRIEKMSVENSQY